MKTSKFFSLGIMALSLILTSCGTTANNSSSQPASNSNSSGQLSENVNSSNNGENKSSSNGSSSTEPNDKVEKTIGSAGGEVKDEATGLGLNIPEGALTNNTNISIEYVNDDQQLSSEPAMGFLGAAEFQPSGTNFSQPVQVSINLTEIPSNDKISVFCYDEVNRIWDYVTEANCVGKKATFSITHFSKYQCLDITPDMLAKYVDIVNQAQSQNKSDAWITSTYKDYLVDEKHVMDYYQEFNDLYYEPCGLFIGGQYQLNGKQGSGDDLTTRVGESNKVGNTYGLSKVAGETVTYDAAKKEMAKTTEKKDAISVTVIVDYKIIQPTIVLSSNKTNLRKGDSTTVNVLVHYAKVSNTLFPDITLPGYTLEISRPKHFSIDKNSVTTNDSGKTSFVVTALDDEKTKETIKAVFDVSGSQGTHAEGAITMNGDSGYTINGHIKQEISLEYEFDQNLMEGLLIVDKTDGNLKLTFEYDFEGHIGFDNNKLSGSVDFNNFNTTFASSGASADVIDPEESAFVGTQTMDLWKTSPTITTGVTSFDFDATNTNDTCILTNKGESSVIVTLNGDTHYVAFDVIGDSFDIDLEYIISFKSDIGLLLPFDLEEGTDTYTSTALKDPVELLFGADGYTTTMEEWAGIVTKNRVEKTTQTITVSI